MTAVCADRDNCWKGVAISCRLYAAMMDATCAVRLSSGEDVAWSREAGWSGSPSLPRSIGGDFDGCLPAIRWFDWSLVVSAYIRTGL
jgi:hypothetical protein